MKPCCTLQRTPRTSHRDPWKSPHCRLGNTPTTLLQGFKKSCWHRAGWVLQPAFQIFTVHSWNVDADLTMKCNFGSELGGVMSNRVRMGKLSKPDRWLCGTPCIYYQWQHKQSVGNAWCGISSSRQTDRQTRIVPTVWQSVHNRERMIFPFLFFFFFTPASFLPSFLW